jgi:hemolysin III
MNARNQNPAKPVRAYSVGEEIANATTHGIGALFSIYALINMVVLSLPLHNAIYTVAFAAFGFSLIMLYSMSCLYHALPEGKAKKVFKILDHSSIYALIAGTYSVYTLVALKGEAGWIVFGIVWGLAILGISLEAFWVYRPKIVSSIIYLAMGWIVVFVFGPIHAALGAQGFALLLWGGIMYTGGTVLYVMKRVKWTHSAWHLFVLAGSVFHYFSVLTLVHGV